MVGGISCVGGLVGFNSSFQVATLTNCYSTAAVNGNSGVGGLVGFNGHRTSIGIRYSKGNIISCWSAGSVFGNEDTGGLVGYPVNAENIAPLGSVSCSFWDVQTSGQTSSAGGTDKTTTEMQTASTFLNAGWDFVDETENGIEDIWWILEGQDYPRLSWEAE